MVHMGIGDREGHKQSIYAIPKRIRASVVIIKIFEKLLIILFYILNFFDDLFLQGIINKK